MILISNQKAMTFHKQELGQGRIDGLMFKAHTATSTVHLLTGCIILICKWE